ncbi:MAG: hypothetical protein ACRC3G_03215 [Bacteroidales bacterium]
MMLPSSKQFIANTTLLPTLCALFPFGTTPFYYHPTTTVIAGYDPQSPIYTQYSFPYGDNTHSALWQAHEDYGQGFSVVGGDCNLSPQ